MVADRVDIGAFIQPHRCLAVRLGIGLDLPVDGKQRDRMFVCVPLQRRDHCGLARRGGGFTVGLLRKGLREQQGPRKSIRKVFAILRSG